VVAAESLIPDFGWPYHRILAEAEERRFPPPPETQDPVESDELADIIVREFIEYYSDYDRTAGRSVDLAWIKISEKNMEDLKDSISELGQALLDALAADPAPFSEEDSETEAIPENGDQIVMAHWEAQTYKFDQFVDIRDFCERTIVRFKNLEENDVRGEVIKKCEAVLEALEACVMLSGCSGFAYQHSYGLSIYFPWARVFESYTYDSGGSDTKFEFADKNTWVDFLHEYVKKTRRPMRESDDMAAAPWSNLAEATLATLSDVLGSGPAGQVKKRIKNILKNQARASTVGGSDDLHAGSRYHRSRYHRSRYHRSRWPGDLEKSVKNFTPVVGTAYWPEE
jgi:hypothetical protein